MFKLFSENMFSAFVLVSEQTAIISVANID
jgi:hypothetical protein